MQTILRPSAPLKQFKQLLLVLAISNLVLPGASQAFQNSPTQININPQQMNRAGVKTEAALPASDGNVTTSNTNVAQSDKGLRLSGTVVAASSASHLLSASVAGVVQNIHVSPLQQVQAGSAVVTIHSPALLEMQREYLQLATQSHLNQEKFQRDDALFKEGIIAQSRLQESRAFALQAEVAASERYQSLRAAGLSDATLKQSLKTKALSATTTIFAKTKGTVLDLQVQLGQRIEAGMPIAKVAGDAPFWIEFHASGSQLSQSNQIRPGDILQIKDCGIAKVMAISPQMDASNQSVLIRAQEIRNGKQSSCLRLNQFVEASHVGHQVIKNSYGVPASALVRSGDRQYVFVKNPQGFEVVDVQVVAGPPDKVWLTGKFGANPQVATQGITILKGAWLGLGADTEVPAKAASASASVPAATNTNGKK